MLRDPLHTGEAWAQDYITSNRTATKAPHTAPDLVAKAPDLIAKAPDLVAKAPDLVAKAPDLVTKAPHTACSVHTCGQPITNNEQLVHKAVCTHELVHT